MTAAYALAYDSAGVRLEAAILARGQAGWDRGAGGRQGPFPPEVPMRPGERPAMLAGATADTFALVYDRANDVAWVGDRRIPVRGANVVLLDRADGIGGPPVVLPPLRVEATVRPASAACAPPASREEYEAHVAAIRAALLRSPEVRAFITP